MPSSSSSSSARSTCVSARGGLFDAELVDERPGIVVICVTGRGAAALFAGEPGGHRWQRTPPNEKRGRVHTSTITVAVLATPARVDLVIRADDVDVETMRGSGAGGQHRNKTDSAVRARHRPTGIEVRCESERSQHMNRDLAMKVLAARVADQARSAIQGARAADRRQQVGSGMRGDKRRTIRTQDDQVTDHVDGRTWRYKAYARGDW
jgi:peptide chain release factor 1